MSKLPEDEPKIEITKNPEFRLVTATEFFGGLFPNGGVIQFYTDIPEPKVNAQGRMETEKVNRELQVEIRLSVMDFKRLGDWMNRHVKRIEEAQKNLKKESTTKSRARDSCVV